MQPMQIIAVATTEINERLVLPWFEAVNARAG